MFLGLRSAYKSLKSIGTVGEGLLKVTTLLLFWGNVCAELLIASRR